MSKPNNQDNEDREPGVYLRSGRWLTQLPPSVQIATGVKSKTFDGYEEAVAWRRMMIDQAGQPLMTASGESRVDEVIGRWLAQHMIKDHTRENKARVIKAYITGKPFGQMRVDAVQPMHINELIATTTHTSTRVMLIDVLTVFFAWTQDNGLTPTNPARRSNARALRKEVEANRDRRPETDAAWTLDQLTYFIDQERDPVYYMMWLLAAATGDRRGELCGMQWHRMDLDDLRVHVSQCIIENGGNPRVEPLPKNWQKRPNFIGPFVAGELADYRADQDIEREDAHTWDARDWVFDQRRFRPMHLAKPGRFIDPQLVTQRLHRHARKLGLPKLSGAHGLRRSFASALRKAGFDEQAQATMLGHTPGLTARYSKLPEPEQREIALVIDKELAHRLS